MTDGSPLNLVLLMLLAFRAAMKKRNKVIFWQNVGTYAFLDFIGHFPSAPPSAASARFRQEVTLF